MKTKEKNKGLHFKTCKIALISTNSGFHLKNRANFHKFWGEDQKKKVFFPKYTRSYMNSGKTISVYSKTTKKQFLLTDSRAITTILGVSSLNLPSCCTEPVNFFRAESSLGVEQFSFGGAQAVIWGGTAPKCPPRRRTWLPNFCTKQYSSFKRVCLPSKDIRPLYIKLCQI